LYNYESQLCPPLKLIPLVVVISFVTFCCTDIEPAKQEKTGSKMAKEMSVKEFEVKSVALNFFSSQGTSAKMRATEKGIDDKEIASVYDFKDKEGDVFMYFVNLKDRHSASPDGDGFVVIAGDRRFIPVLGYGEEGALHPDDLNPGLEIWIDYVKTVYERVKHKEDRSEGTEYLWKNFKLGIGSKSRLTDDEYGGGCPENYDNTYGPHLNTHWDQVHPYNYFSPAESGCSCNKALAGCGPVAIAKVYNFYQKPDFYVYGWYDFPLDATLSGTYSCTDFSSAPLRERQIATLIHAAGTKASSNYGYLGTCNTLTWRNDVKTAFSNASYSNSGTRGGYISDLHNIKNNLRTGHPGIMDGSTALFTDDWHIWVIDGIREIMYYYENTFPPGSCTGIGTTYMHFNWGWGNPSQNAWYAFDNFTPIGKTEEYDYALHVTYGMRP
jgi:hypothetical protein